MSGPAAISQPPQFVPFGKYLLLERLAIGGMAEVYLAKSFDDGASDLLAIKRILPSLAENEGFIRMFLDEAKIAGRLQHPGIVRIQELGRIGASHYLAMDFVWGKDLLAIMRRCRLLGTQLTPAFVAWVGASMCEALHYAHTKKDPHGRPMAIIHRDISPQNVLVSFDGRVKIIDFGIAKAQSRTTSTQAGVLKGKVGYMSPEQVQGHEIDHRSDLFAVGTCLYELLTLRSLFARENNFEAMENVRHVRAKPVRQLRADVPAGLEAVLSRSMQADPAARYQSARDLHYELLHFLNTHAPGYDRVSAVAWLRDAFRKEFGRERVRLDAFDQIGRPQVSPADAPHRNSATDLEIPRTQNPPPPDLDDEGETQVFDEPPDFLTAPPMEQDTGPTEVFFSSDEVPDERPQSDQFAPPSADGDVSLDPSQISSGMIEKLMDDPADRAHIARQPTEQQRALRVDPPSRAPASEGGWGKKVAMGLVLLLVGALGAYLLTSLSAQSVVEVRTQPSAGASVLLDGVQRGTAPVRLENVASGHHVVTIVADGYEDATREIDVGDNATVMVDVALSPLPDAATDP